MAFAIGCSEDAGTNDPPIPDKPTDQAETVTVSFAMKGDVSVEETPLITKAAGEETESKDLYGIIVYYDADQSGKIDDYYGEGFFDNINDMTISLITGYKYQFICTLIKNGKDILKHTDSVSFNGFDVLRNKGYLEPFGYVNREYTPRYWEGREVKNEFVLGNENSTNLSIQRLRSGDARCNDGREKIGGSYYSIYYPSIDRYYGEITDYSPKDNGVVNIDMKRCVFGVKFVVTGITDGVLGFSMSDETHGPTLFFRDNIKVDTIFDKAIYTYRNIYECWSKSLTTDDYSQDFFLLINWQRDNGVTQSFRKTITFKRNVLTTVNIRMNGGNADNNLNLNIEDSEMEENTNLDINVGDTIDTPVNPTE